MSEAEAMQDWDDEGLYDDWLDSEEDDDGLWHKPPPKEPKGKPKVKRKKRKNSIPRGKMVNMVCHCGAKYQSRKADLLRGWGLSCSKSCAAKRREFGLPEATILGEI